MIWEHYSVCCISQQPRPSSHATSINASERNNKKTEWNINFRNGTTIKGTAVNGTAVKKLSLARSILPILGTHLHTKRKEIVYTGLQL